MTRAEAKAYRNKVVQGETVEKLGGITEKIEQSDKIGYDWHNYYVGDKLVKSIYVEQDNPVGTQDNPFTWESGMKLILNGYYSYNGKRYVAIQEGSPTEITDEFFVEF
nr:MAG TPA: hypothetical protein [Caudoviricetes sp.]